LLALGSNGKNAGHAIKQLWVGLLFKLLSRNNFRQDIRVVHLSVTKQYNLVLARGQWMMHASGHLTRVWWYNCD